MSGRRKLFLVGQAVVGATLGTAAVAVAAAMLMVKFELRAGEWTLILFAGAITLLILITKGYALFALTFSAAVVTAAAVAYNAGWLRLG